jgi:hypothetical protein
MLQPHELEAVGGGAANARAALKSVREQGVAHAMQPGKAYSDFAPKIQKAERGLAAAEDVQKKGLTSLPGYVRGVQREGLGPTFRASAREQLANTPLAMTALTLGLPAAAIAGTLMKKEAPEGPGRGENIGAGIGGLVGGLAGSAMPLAGNVVAGAGGAAVGKMLGRGVDRLRGRKAQPMFGQRSPNQMAEPSNEGQHIPSERIMSPAAAGQQREVV